MNAERPTRLRWSRALCRCPPWSREASPEIKKKRSGFDQGPVRVLAGCLSAHLLRKTALGSIEQAQRSTDTPARSQLDRVRLRQRHAALFCRRSAQTPAAAGRRGRPFRRGTPARRAAQENATNHAAAPQEGPAVLQAERGDAQELPDARGDAAARVAAERAQGRHPVDLHGRVPRVEPARGPPAAAAALAEGGAALGVALLDVLRGGRR